MEFEVEFAGTGIEELVKAEPGKIIVEFEEAFASGLGRVQLVLDVPVLDVTGVPVVADGAVVEASATSVESAAPVGRLGDRLVSDGGGATAPVTPRAAVVLLLARTWLKLRNVWVGCSVELVRELAGSGGAMWRPVEFEVDRMIVHDPADPVIFAGLAVSVETSSQALNGGYEEDVSIDVLAVEPRGLGRLVTCETEMTEDDSLPKNV